MTSLAIWMEQAPQEQQNAAAKADELLPHLQAALEGFPAGRSQAALTAALHEAEVKFDKTKLPGFLALLAESGQLVVDYGARGAKVIRLPNRKVAGGSK